MRISPHRKKLFLLAAGLGLAALLALVLFGPEPERVFGFLQKASELFQSWVRALPLWAFFLALAVLPAVGAPLSAFYLALGALDFPTAIALAAASLLFSQTLGYWMASSLMRPLALRLVRRTRYSVPEIRRSGAWKIVAFVRICGLPFSFQNWILGLARAPFGTYLLWSMIVQTSQAALAIYFGASLLKGKWGALIVAVIALIVLSLLFRYWRRQLATRRLAEPSPGNTEP